MSEATGNVTMLGPWGWTANQAVLACWTSQICSVVLYAGHVRAAASTCLAFLACHPLGAKGDTCLWGPFRTKLLSVGALGALLKAALTSSSDDPCNNIIQQTAAVGIMYLCTMVGQTVAAEGNGLWH